ncbi:Alpha/Beta hydrolase protein [Fomes fomentarius]|nr:Alpha/Beta hydrolase protein [Fomes fomentarius]
MVYHRALRLVFAALVHSLWTGAIPVQDGPVVQLDSATVLGIRQGSTLERFLGIPFAQPPIGDLRLRLPQLLTSYNGTLNATAYGNQCLAQAGPSIPTESPELFQDIVAFATRVGGGSDVPQSEDCLSINVIRPANISVDAKLPILVWIYGGGFTQGSNAFDVYNGSAIVERSVEIGQPIIFAAMNYRLDVFGFLGGKEIKEAGLGNLGLHDQRTALRWVNKFIPAFGGDPDKVTIWGQSAGSISVASQLLTNDGDTEGLFRAGIMSSASLAPTGDITEVQSVYDFAVDHVGCSGAADTLACLRTVSAESLREAADLAPPGPSVADSLSSPFLPRADGVFLKARSKKLAIQGKLAKIPFIIGDTKDEGTVAAAGHLNVTTDDDFADFVSSHFIFPGASRADIQPILDAYPSDPAAGSPFDTGSANAFTPQFKRIAALQADWFFNANRRALLDTYSGRQPTYNFLSSRDAFPGVGAAHGADLLNAFGPGDMTDYFIRFVHALNPNAEDGVQWPRYDTTTRSSLEFKDGESPLGIYADVERADGINAAFALSLQFPV